MQLKIGSSHILVKSVQTVMASETQRQSDLGRALAAGVELQRTGRHADAEQNYTRLLSQWPNHPDVLQLLGVALKAQGKFGEAEERLRQSLALNARQPHVWNNLGNLLTDLRRFDEAAFAFKNALEIDGRYVDALVGLGGALLSSGKPDDAANAYQRASDLQPQNASAAIGLATVATRRGNEERAEKLLCDVLAAEPDNAAALHNLGMNYAVKGDGERAQALIERAVRLRPRRADMLTSLGYVLQISGRTAAAIQHYRKAISQNPLHVAAYEDLARLLWQTTDRESYIDDLDAAIVSFPNAVELHLSRASLLALAKRYADADEEYACADRLQPGNPIALDGRARMAAELGEVQRSVETHERALRTGAGLPWVHVSRGHTLLRFGRAREAIEALENALALDPLDQLALADLALALRAVGDPRERWLADYERFAVTVEVPPPRGYNDMSAFNEDLDRALDELHHIEAEPIDQSLRRGTQTLGSLFGRKCDLITRLRERLDQVVQSYIDALPDDPSHPFLRRRAKSFRYRGSWSARLKNSGFHVTHVHPQGWISSAYYVALPACVGDSEKKEGWFTLGDPPFDVQWCDRVRRYVQPREGMLVLFPSYFYHGTVPFSDEQARTSVAFDVTPVA